MPTVDDLSQSNYLKQGDVDPRIKVTIDHWAKEEVGPRRELNFVLYFAEKHIKPLVLKSENGARITALTGKKEFDEWAGFQITLFRDPTIKFGTEIKGGIRVLMPGEVIPQPYQQPVQASQGQAVQQPPDPSDGQIPEEQIPF